MTATGEADEAARLAGIATARMKRIGLLLSGVVRRHRRRAARGQPLLGRAEHGGRLFPLRDRRGAARHDDVRARPAEHSRHASSRALVLKVLGNGLVLLGAPYYVQDIVLGVIIIGSVAFSASALKKAAFKV